MESNRIGSTPPSPEPPRKERDEELKPETQKAQEAARTLFGWDVTAIGSRVLKIGSQALGAVTSAFPQIPWKSQLPTEFTRLEKKIGPFLTNENREILLQFLEVEGVRKLFGELLDLHEKLTTEKVPVIDGFVKDGPDSSENLKRYKELLFEKIRPALIDANIDWGEIKKPHEKVYPLLDVLDGFVASSNTQYLADFIPLGFGADPNKTTAPYYRHVHHLEQALQKEHSPLEESLLRRGFFRAPHSSAPWWLKVESAAKEQTLEHTVGLALTTGAAYEGKITIDLSALETLTPEQNLQIGAFLRDYVSKGSITAANETFNPQDLHLFDDSQQAIIRDIGATLFREGVTLISKLVQSLANPNANFDGVRSLEKEILFEQQLIQFERDVGLPLSYEARQSFYQAFKSEETGVALANFIVAYNSKDLEELYRDLRQLQEVLVDHLEEYHGEINRVLQKAVDERFGKRWGEQLKILSLQDPKLMGQLADSFDDLGFLFAMDKFMNRAQVVSDYTAACFEQDQMPNLYHASYKGYSDAFAGVIDKLNPENATAILLFGRTVQNTSTSSMTQQIADAFCLGAFESPDLSSKKIPDVTQRFLAFRAETRADPSPGGQRLLSQGYYNWMPQNLMFDKGDWKREYDASGRLTATGSFSFAQATGQVRDFEIKVDFTTFPPLEKGQYQDLFIILQKVIMTKSTSRADEELDKASESIKAIFPELQDQIAFRKLAHSLHFEVTKKSFLAQSSLATGKAHPGIIDKSFPV